MLKRFVNRYAFIVAASILALASITGCSIPNRQFGDIPDETRLAISSDGNRLFVYWKDYKDNIMARLLELNGTAVVSRRDIAVPANIVSAEFAKNSHELLITTKEKCCDGELLKIDLDTGKRILIYKSPFSLRFPLEMSDGSYVFLEGRAGGYSTWKRFHQGSLKELNDRPFGLAAPLNVVGESLFIFTPAKKFLAIHGDIPKNVQALADSSTYFIVCANTNSLVCLRDSIHISNDANSYYVGTFAIFNHANRCDVAGRWIDAREAEISRNGTTVVFHAAKQKEGGERAIYAIRNTSRDCLVQLISVNGE